MENLLNNPIIQSSLLPLLISLALAGVIGFSLPRGPRFAAISVGISALITIVIISGFTFPPKATSQKLPYLMIVGLVTGLLLDSFNIRGKIYQLTSLMFPAAAICWLFGARISTADLPGIFYLILITLMATVTLIRGNKRQTQIDTGLALLFVSGGLGGILLIGSSAMLAQTAFALMAAIGGLLLWNWPKFRFNIGASVLFPIVAILSAMAAQSLYFTKASGIALSLMIPLLLIDKIMPMIPLLNRSTTPFTRALSLGTVGLVLLPVAIGSAILLTETSSYSY